MKRQILFHELGRVKTLLLLTPYYRDKIFGTLRITDHCDARVQIGSA